MKDTNSQIVMVCHSCNIFTNVLVLVTLVVVAECVYLMKYRKNSSFYSIQKEVTPHIKLSNIGIKFKDLELL